MSLAPLVLQDETYANFYEDLSNKECYVILDNGAFEMAEQGRGVDAQTLVACAKRVRASEVICPDILYDGPATVKATEDFVDECWKLDPSWARSVSFMGVIQGSTVDEYLDCAIELAPVVQVLGLSKLAVPKCYGSELPMVATRQQALLDVASCVGRDSQVHLLGGDWSLPLEIAAQSKNPLVRSNDSSFSYWYPMRKARLSKANLPVDSSGRLKYVKDRPDLQAQVPLAVRTASSKIAARLLELAR